MEDFELELKMDFLNESVDLLTHAEDAFLRLEKERENDQLINEIFRLAHNLKGTSKAVGFEQLAQLTHVAENLILKIKEKQILANDAIISSLLEFKDKIHEMIRGLKEDFQAIFKIDDIKDKLEKMANQTWEQEPAAPIADKANDDNNLEIKFTQEESQPIHNELAPKEEVTVTKEPQRAPIANIENNSDESIRVKLSRIDKINNVIGELVIIQTVVSQRRFEFIKDDLSNKSIAMMGKLFKEIQELAMSLRMLPIKSTFQKMSRIVRDTSKSVNKNINLTLIGEETEVDKTVLEHIGDPLVHIMRNAVDHGIESNEKRIQSGKNIQGEIELKAFHEGSNLIIQITDDGGGIDHEVIRKKAIEKKIIKENQNLTTSQIINLIFHPGFSTKDQVNEVSGRGVGMDVVKTNIEALGGEVKILTNIGVGSSFKIILPLTMAIIDGLVISSGKEKFVIPLNQVFELTNLQQKDINHYTNGPTLIKLRGEVLPIFYLNSKLGIPVEKRPQEIIILIRGMAHAFGIVVDDIINQQQIVIKKLGEDIRHSKGIMGSTIMGDGRPSFILDLYELFKDDLRPSKAHDKLKRATV